MKLQRLSSVSLAFSCALLSACSSLDVWQYKPSPLSGSPRGKIALVLLPAGPAQGDGAQGVNDIIAKDPDLASVIRAGCVRPEASPGAPATPSTRISPSGSAAFIPIIAAVAQLGFEAFIDKKRRDVEAINDSANALYSMNVAVPPTGQGGLADARCLVILRYVEDEKTGTSLNMAAVLKIKTHAAGTTPSTNVISLKPVFVRANNAVATTRDVEKATMDFSFAVSVKAVARDNAGNVSRLIPAGEAVAPVRGVILGRPGVISCAAEDCGDSDLLPYPVNRGVLSLSIAIAEQGKTGFDSKAVDAELASIKAALGPAIGEAIKTKLGE